MDVSDHFLAAIGALVSLAWAIVSFFLTSIEAFAPTPNAETASTSRKGCLSLVLAVGALAWFVGVLVTGSWSWGR